MKVLVAGGAGFIGSHYVRALLGEDRRRRGITRVTVVDALTYAGNPANLRPVAQDPRLTFVHGDIRDRALLSTVVPGHDVVVNFAAETHVDRSIAAAEEFVSTNVLGVQTLMQACLEAHAPRVVHVSTDEVYGSVADGSRTEDAPLAPTSPYAAAKAGGDLIALAYARTHGLPVTVTRSSNTYGPYQFPEKVIPRFITNLLDGDVAPLYGTGRNVRGWMHADDHCRAIRLVVDEGVAGEVYHIGGDTELTNLELAARLLAACGADESRVRHIPDRKGHDYRYAIDDTKLRRLGYAPRVGFDEGLAATVRWYRQNRSWWEPLKRRTAVPADIQ